MPAQALERGQRIAVRIEARLGQDPHLQATAVAPFQHGQVARRCMHQAEAGSTKANATTLPCSDRSSVGAALSQCRPWGKSGAWRGVMCMRLCRSPVHPIARADRLDAGSTIDQTADITSHPAA